MSSIKPASDHLLVKLVESSPSMMGGIHVPQSAAKAGDTVEAQVVSLGSGYDEGMKVRWEASVGDTILMGRHGNVEIKHGGERLILIRNADILAVISG